MFARLGLILTCFAVLTVSVSAADWSASMETGAVQLTSAGPITFGPEGVLFVSDPMAASIYAIDTGDTSGSPADLHVDVPDVRSKVASLLATTPENVEIADLAVNPLSGHAYLSVRRGSGPDAAAVVLRIAPSGDISELSLKNVKHSKATLRNAPESRRRRGRDVRMQAVTDLLFVDGRLFIAGLSNEEFASKLRSISFPFADATSDTSVEIYHGAHGAFETRSPVSTFTAYKIDGEQHLLASYTCTPLVKFPVAQLQPNTKLMGTTIAELGNRNRPLDMFVYNKNGKDYILIANSSRGVMKVTTDNIDQIEAITEQVRRGGTAGLPYETIESLEGVTQLDRLNDSNALALVVAKDGTENLKTIGLP